MNAITRNRRSGKLLGALGLTALLAVLAGSPALADNGRDRGDRGRGHERHEQVRRGHDRGPRHHRDRRYGYDYDLRRHRHDHRRFEVPRHIHRLHRSDHRRYYRGRVWVPVHHHYHVIYRFPVYTSVGLVYRDYPYCEGSLYHDGISGYLNIEGRHISIGIGF